MLRIQSPLAPELEQLVHRIIGCCIAVHREWGPGLVLAAEGDRLTVLFDEYGYRELATQVVSRKHLLTPA